MKYLSLSEFKNLTQLTDAALVYLLEENRLDLQLGNDGTLQINVDSVDTTEIAQAIAQEYDSLLDDHKEILREKLATMLGEELDQLLDSALGQVLGK